MKKIRLLLEYGCYPVWVYDEEGEMINNDLPDEFLSDKEIKNICEKIQTEYDSLFVDSEIEFSYRGFSTPEEEADFKEEVDFLEKILKEKCKDKYWIQNDVYSGYPQG